MHFKNFPFILGSIIGILFLSLAGVLVWANASDSENQAEESKENQIISEKEQEDAKVKQEAKKEADQFAGNSKEMRKLVSEKHKFYNDSLGWGRRDNGNFDLIKQREKAEEIHYKLTNMNTYSVVEEHDIEKIKTLAKTLMETDVRGIAKNKASELHRMFHDLDIAINDYNNYDKVWNVTKTLKEKREEERN